MLGSIIGDVVGSIYELDNIKTKSFPLFSAGCAVTDDSILSVATADWLLRGGDCAVFYRDYALRYPDPMGAYGERFRQWAADSRVEIQPPYNSCGNGSAMRVGPVGWAAQSEREVLDWAKASAECTHNHPEGIKGAQAVALGIFLARHGADAAAIRSEITSRFHYDLSRSCDEIRHGYGWEATCQKSVPEAITACLEAADFEDAVRNAVSLGGDSDTIACISGSLAEALFGIPDAIRQRAETYLNGGLADVVQRFEARFGFGIPK